jgi:hypothetical protein
MKIEGGTYVRILGGYIDDIAISGQTGLSNCFNRNVGAGK